LSISLKERLQAHVAQIARDRDPYFATEGRFYVRQYVRQQLMTWGQVETYDFTSLGQTHQHLLLNLPGQQSRPPIVIGAHYDAVPNSPGADDNASGVAVLIELARSLHDQLPRYPVRLIAFDFEETDYDHAGSTLYGRQIQGEPLRLMLSLEMLGYCAQSPNSQNYPLAAMKAIYPSQGNFVALVGNLPTIGDMWHFRRWFRWAGVPCAGLPIPKRGTILPETRRSDHAIFWDLGYRAMMVTDTSYLRNPHYHQPSDRPETLDFDFMARICMGLAEAVRRL